MNRTVVIEQLRTTQQTLEKLLALLEACEQDRLESHLYRSRQEYRSVCQRAGKGNKQIERCAIPTFRVAESMGFNGDLQQWEHLRGLAILGCLGVTICHIEGVRR
jgi:hypothetical protein